MYKILITTSGTGSRLKLLTGHKNKALIEIGNKKVIDYIFEVHDSNNEFVITIGYYGEQVKTYIKNTFPNHNITFVQVDPFQGEGSSLGYSMLQAKKYLDCPFVFHCNDSIISGNIPSPELCNWDGIFQTNNPNIFNPEDYSTVIISENKILKINPKGTNTFDAFHIGVVGIKDFKMFWDILEREYLNDKNNYSLNDCHVIEKMISEKIEFKAIHFDQWYDTGNLKSLSETIKNLNSI